MPEVPSALVRWPEEGKFAFSVSDDTNFGKGFTKKGGRDEGFCRLRRMLTERP